MTKNRHLNIATCSKCEEVMSACKNQELLDFYRKFREVRLDGHVSCCYRGPEAQEEAFRTGTSKAHFGESPHNYALAVDFFQLTQAQGAAFSMPWYRNYLKPACEAAGLTWGGSFSFVDGPHAELKNWKELAKKGPAK